MQGASVFWKTVVLHPIELDFPEGGYNDGASCCHCLQDAGYDHPTFRGVPVRQGRGARTFWDFAIELPNLLASGLTRSDLRWLASKGYVLHACEITDPRDTVRQFRQGLNLAFTERTCFVLTPAGAEFARTALSESPIPAVRAPAPADVVRISPSPPHQSERPEWDPDRRILRVGDRVVKWFRAPCANQELVLAVFQEEGWPSWIADPLPPKDDQDPKRRLNDTIKSLNRNQDHNLIIFRGDGKGEGIVWELTRDVVPVLSRSVP